jgi:hypothetical protein
VPARARAVCAHGAQAARASGTACHGNRAPSRSVYDERPRRPGTHRSAGSSHTQQPHRHGGAMSEDHQPYPPPATPAPTPPRGGAGAWTVGRPEVLESGGPAAPAGPSARSRGWPARPDRRRRCRRRRPRRRRRRVRVDARRRRWRPGRGPPACHRRRRAQGRPEPLGLQKLDAVRFFEKFPEARKEFDAQGGDLRKLLYTKLTADSEDAPAWSEVEGWLGDRMAWPPSGPGGQGRRTARPHPRRDRRGQGPHQPREAARRRQRVRREGRLGRSCRTASHTRRRGGRVGGPSVVAGPVLPG